MKNFITKLIASIMLITGVVFAGLAFSTTVSNPTYAVPGDEGSNIDDPTTTPSDINTPEDTEPDDNSSDDNPDTTDEDTSDEQEGEDGDTDSSTIQEATTDICRQETGALYWIVCPAISFASNVTDSLYTAINDFLVINPLEMTSTSPVYQVWQYMRTITNIVFVILLLIVIISQVTGLGINNYGIKRVLPRLIITVILVNLSFHFCAVLTDVSNIVGENLRTFFQSIQDNITMNGAISEAPDISFTSILTVIIGGGSIAGIVIGATGGLGALLWSLVPILLAGLVAIITGLITIAARQAIITLLVMIAPLAFVAFLLPNTERWFGRWKDMFARMLIFYPVFSFLFGASKLAGWAIIASAPNAPTILLGLAVQIFPLFGSWSLMKMSGTVLGSLNTAMRKLAEPAQKFATGWATEHADRNRQTYWMNNYSAGSRLRGFLDYRQKLRLLDAQNAKEGREARALDRAYRKAASITGRDKLGNTTFEDTPNRYTRNAKTAKYFDLRATGSQLAYKNTLNGYGRVFGKNDSAAARLAHESFESFSDLAAQRYLEINEAQADQEALLKRYLEAENESDKNVYQYNRLIKDASGGLRHFGASSIMGQVIQGVSAIEQRRRTEARIMITKFGVDKASFRGMAFDIAHINDNGFEHDGLGHVIEDDMYNVVKGQHAPWPYYIGVHKETGDEITKEEYDALDPDEKDAYRKVRYFYMKDQKKNRVQCVFEDDPGYMKELLLDDVGNIADPIVNRYAFSIGTAKNDRQEDGVLSRYRSTIAGIISSFKEHDAAYTSMLAAHLNNGTVASPGELNIAKILSFNASAKSNMLPVNDAGAIETWIKHLSTIQEGNFSHYFPDESIEDFVNINHEVLKGARLAYRKDEATGKFILDGNGEKIPYWDTVEYSASDITTEDRRNFIKHKAFAKSVVKLVGIVGRELSPGIRENQKPETLKALVKLADLLVELGVRNVDPNVPFEEKIDPDTDLFESEDPSILKQRIDEGRNIIRNMLGKNNPPTPPSGGASGTGGTPSGGSPIPPSSGGGSTGGGASPSGGSGGNTSGGSPTPPAGSGSPTPDPSVPNLKAIIEAEYRKRNSRSTIMDAIRDITLSSTMVVEYRDKILNLFGGTECLCQSELISQVNQVFSDYLAMRNTDALDEATNFYNNEKRRIDEISSTIYQIAEQANMFLP